MPVCGKRVTRTTRSGEEITPTLAYGCEVKIPDGETEHKGPCASPSDMASVQRRQQWEAENERDERIKSHAASGLAMTQSIPMSSASIVEDPDRPFADPAHKLARVHPDSPVVCPFCTEKPMKKNFEAHVRMHRGDDNGQWNRDAQARVINAIPQPPASLADRKQKPATADSEVAFMPTMLDPPHPPGVLTPHIAKAILVAFFEERHAPAGDDVVANAWATLLPHLP